MTKPLLTLVLPALTYLYAKSFGIFTIIIPFYYQHPIFTIIIPF